MLASLALTGKFQTWWSLIENEPQIPATSKTVIALTDFNGEALGLVIGKGKKTKEMGVVPPKKRALGMPTF